LMQVKQQSRIHPTYQQGETFSIRAEGARGAGLFPAHRRYQTPPARGDVAKSSSIVNPCGFESLPRPTGRQSLTVNQHHL
jgi:hypothetical protein